MSQSCCVDEKNTIVVACSGASNLGQISNAVAVKIQEQHMGQMTCLAALGARVDSYIKAVSYGELVVIDGCPFACAQKVVEGLDIQQYTYFDISKLLPDLAKGKRYDQVEAESDKVLEMIKAQIYEVA